MNPQACGYSWDAAGMLMELVWAVILLVHSCPPALDFETKTLGLGLGHGFQVFGFSKG